MPATKRTIALPGAIAMPAPVFSPLSVDRTAHGAENRHAGFAMEAFGDGFAVVSPCGLRGAKQNLSERDEPV